MFGYSKNELVGHSVESLLPDGHRWDHGALGAAFSEGQAARPVGFGHELRGRHKDGREIPVEIGLNPLGSMARHSPSRRSSTFPRATRPSGIRSSSCES